MRRALRPTRGDAATDAAARVPSTRKLLRLVRVLRHFAEIAGRADLVDARELVGCGNPRQVRVARGDRPSQKRA
jgi:hypothetical protein